MSTRRTDMDISKSAEREHFPSPEEGVGVARSPQVLPRQGGFYDSHKRDQTVFVAFAGIIMYTRFLVYSHGPRIGKQASGRNIHGNTTSPTATPLYFMYHKRWSGLKEEEETCLDFVPTCNSLLGTRVLLMGKRFTLCISLPR